MKTVWDKVKNIDFILSGICLAALVTLTILGVVMRYVVHNPFTWLEEVQKGLMVWISFYAGSIAFRTGGHVAIEILVDAMPISLQKVMEHVIEAVVVVTLLFVAYNGASLMMLHASVDKVTNILKIPYWLIDSAVPIGCLLMCINFICSRVHGIEEIEEVQHE
ncbi:MAG: TRAP transporter small permease [Blautia sp.]|jgi:TRAP-type C4-dicarboxylate transport system permease small subunit